MKERKYISPTEAKQLLDFLKQQSTEPDESFSTRQSTWKKLHAFVATMIYTGCRTKEARHLQLRDITFGRKPSIYIRTSKNGDSRHCPVPNKLKTILQPYVKSLNSDNPEQFLFTAKKANRPFTHQAIHKYFKLACLRAGIGEEHSLHSCRHGFGFLLYSKSKDIRMTATLMGHKSLQSTTIYTAVDPESMRQQINAIF